MAVVDTIELTINADSLQEASGALAEEVKAIIAPLIERVDQLETMLREHIAQSADDRKALSRPITRIIPPDAVG